MVRSLDYTSLSMLLEYDNLTIGACRAVITGVYLTILTLLFFLAGAKKGPIMGCGASGARLRSILPQPW